DVLVGDVHPDAIEVTSENPRRGVLERDAVAGRVADRLDHLFRIEEHRRIKGPVDGTAVLGPSTATPLSPLLPPGTANAVAAQARRNLTPRGRLSRRPSPHG